MHDWRDFNNVSFESTMIILYYNSMTTVTHPTTWSQQNFVLGFSFFLARTLQKRLCTMNKENGSRNKQVSHT